MSHKLIKAQNSRSQIWINYSPFFISSTVAVEELTTWPLSQMTWVQILTSALIYYVAWIYFFFLNSVLHHHKGGEMKKTLNAMLGIEEAFNKYLPLSIHQASQTASQHLFGSAVTFVLKWIFTYFISWEFIFFLLRGLISLKSQNSLLIKKRHKIYGGFIRLGKKYTWI